MVRASLAHEQAWAFLLALITAAIVFEPRVKGGGFNADDWALYAAFKFPQAEGFHTSVSALEHSAGSRIGHMFYWLLSFSLFGEHTRFYTATAGLLAVILAFTFYVLLRELHFSPVQSAAMMLLTIVAPSLSTVRFWFTPAGIQISLSLFFIGLTLSLRAFAGPKDRRLRLHAISWCFYLASAVYAETALPLMGVCVLVYSTRVPFVAAVRRWGFDLLIVVVGYAATLSFVNSRPGFSKLPASRWGEHAHLIADQALTIFTQMLGPLGGSNRSLELIGMAVVATGAFVLWAKGNISPGSRPELERWGVTFGVCLIATIAGYAVFVPAMLYYEPLGPGLAAHINIVTAAPLAGAIFAMLMLARIALLELVGRHRQRLGLLITAVIVIWYASIVIDSGLDVRNDAHIWALASERDYDVLHTLTTDLPHPVHNATIYTFGEAGTVAPGLPIFFTSWELNNAVKVAYHRSDLSAYPMVTDGMQPTCTPHGVMASVEATPVNSPSAYDLSYFVDIAGGKYALINNMVTCTAALSRFQIGPYALTSLLWAQ